MVLHSTLKTLYQIEQINESGQDGQFPTQKLDLKCEKKIWEQWFRHQPTDNSGTWLCLPDDYLDRTPSTQLQMSLDC